MIEHQLVDLVKTSCFLRERFGGAASAGERRMRVERKRLVAQRSSRARVILSS